MEETLPLFEEVKVGSPSWLWEGWGALPWHLGLEVGEWSRGQQAGTWEMVSERGLRAPLGMPQKWGRSAHAVLCCPEGVGETEARRGNCSWGLGTPRESRARGRRWGRGTRTWPGCPQPPFPISGHSWGDPARCPKKRRGPELPIPSTSTRPPTPRESLMGCLKPSFRFLMSSSWQEC